uniref:C-type lectin domain-containing protein n=1 Tax=Anabas testudineus TaxID=64144 RepID=A0A3Q1H6Y4_ANATE
RTHDSLLSCNKGEPHPYLTCDRGWEQHGGKCYYFSTSGRSWEESRYFCRRRGGDLVKIDSREEQMNFVDDHFWIGLTDVREEGKWLWVDGSPLDTSLTFWSGTEPDDWKDEHPDGEDCASMGEKHGAADLKCWFDRPCNMHQSIICEKPVEIGRY